MNKYRYILTAGPDNVSKEGGEMKKNIHQLGIQLSLNHNYSKKVTFHSETPK